MARYRVLFSLLLLSYFYCTISANSVVRVSGGLLCGTQLKTRLNRTLLAFMGIPYAEPPVRELRFQSPVPKRPWNGTLNVQKSGSPCTQYNSQNRIIGDEDCLVLNVYTPELHTSSAKRTFPVMVFLHGGGYIIGEGSHSAYGPEYLLDRDVVLVTLNYRLGVFGFLSTGDTESPGNNGLKDQLLALKWVNQNIRAFGGNPNKVTLFGVSAGAGLASFHALSSQSQAYFQSYILDSGTPIAPWSFAGNKEYYDYPRQIGLRFNCSTANTSILIECLRQQNRDKLHTVSVAVREQNGISYAPTIEPISNDAFFVESPEVLFRQHKMKDAPVISGSVADEGLEITIDYYVNKTKYEALVTEPRNELYKMLNLFQPVRANLTDVHALIDKLIEFYFENKLPMKSDRASIEDTPPHKKETVKNFCGTRGQILQRFTDLIGDYFFNYPQYLTQLMLSHNKNSTFVHHFEYLGTYSLTQPVTRNYDLIGVDHADELFYLYHMDNPVGLYPIKRRSTDYEMIDTMIDLWSSFALKGVPTTRKLPKHETWRPYNCPESKCYLQIGNRTDPSLYPRNRDYSRRMEFWRKNAPVFPL